MASCTAVAVCSPTLRAVWRPADSRYGDCVAFLVYV